MPIGVGSRKSLSRPFVFLVLDSSGGGAIRVVVGLGCEEGKRLGARVLAAMRIGFLISIPYRDKHLF